MRLLLVLVLVLVLVPAFAVTAQLDHAEPWRIPSWNIEHLVAETDQG